MPGLAIAFIWAGLLVVDPPGGVDLLQGEWKSTKIVRPRIEIKESLTLVIQGHRFTETRKFVDHGSITLGLPQQPYAFEKVSSSQKKEIATTRGRFELRGDMFLECFAVGNSNEIPTNLSPDAGNRYLLWEWRRLPRPEAEKGEAASGIDGTWNLVSMNVAGTRIEGEAIEGFKWTVKQGRYTRENDTEEKGVIRLDSSKSPKWIDFELTHPTRFKGSMRWGIFKLDGDTLMVDTGDARSPLRPVDFEANQPGTNTHAVYERVNPADRIPNAVLNAKGLERSGEYYILSGDSEAVQRFQDTGTLLKRIGVDSRKYSEQLSLEKKAFEVMHGLTKEQLRLMARLRESTNLLQSISIRARIHELSASLEEMEARQPSERDRSEAHRAGELHIEQLCDQFDKAMFALEDSISRVLLKYKSLSEDETVRDALILMNRSANRKVALGPSPPLRTVAVKMKDGMPLVREDRENRAKRLEELREDRAKPPEIRPRSEPNPK